MRVKETGALPSSLTSKTSTKTPLFRLFSLSPPDLKNLKQGIIGLVLLDAEGRVVRETGDVRLEGREARSSKEKKNQGLSFIHSLVSTLVKTNPLKLSTLSLSKKIWKQHDACTRAGQAGLALASLGRAMVRDVDAAVRLSNERAAGKGR